MEARHASQMPQNKNVNQIKEPKILTSQELEIHFIQIKEPESMR